MRFQQLILFLFTDFDLSMSTQCTKKGIEILAVIVHHL